MRFQVRVKPRASANRVGGTWGADALVVAVTAPAVDGRANSAVIQALADALCLRSRQVRIVSGSRHRTKLVEIAEPPPDLGARLEELRST